jgi:glucokinase
VPGEELAKLAGYGDEQAALAFFNYGLHLGELINLICYVIDPEIIILGGSVSKSFELYKSGLTESLKGFYFDHRDKVKISPSMLKDSGIYGAAGLFFDQEEKKLS